MSAAVMSVKRERSGVGAFDGEGACKSRFKVAPRNLRCSLLVQAEKEGKTGEKKISD